ncbi:MAG: hypothetical protein Hyperionvirus10_2 [Hyperionvirus sp.]|uniref:Uncharacterized protein n=1 Tax=Hyperionvirus sp. TaxID=2487770 RepID=A0A3G5A8R6_9VIRU|nr:MAG: hypothetical protein Hyperionvirus10_2 [Hyperionvirus sp.]
MTDEKAFVTSEGINIQIAAARTDKEVDYTVLAEIRNYCGDSNYTGPRYTGTKYNSFSSANEKYTKHWEKDSPCQELMSCCVELMSNPDKYSRFTNLDELVKALSCVHKPVVSPIDKLEPPAAAAAPTS